MTHLVLYGSKEMYRSAVLCKQSAYKQGIQYVWQWEEPALKNTEFYEQNKELLDQPRGCGYWAWKPFIILDTLLNRCEEGNICVYADAGVEWINSPDHIINRMDQDIFLFGNQYNHIHWCKSDVMKTLNHWYSGSQVQASVLFIRKTDKSVKFVKEWLEWCCIPEMIDDSPSKVTNHPEFQEHRHDQAILTTLAHREGYTNFHWWPAMYNNGAFTYERGGRPTHVDTYPVIFHHHRKRNHEWLKGDHMNMQNSVR